MGHLGHVKEEYRELVERLDAGPVALPEPRDPRAWEGWREILEILYTPEEAALASKMPVRPATLEALSKHIGLAENELRSRLDPMCDKGLIMDLVHPRTGQTSYMLSPPVVGFFEFSMMRAHDSIPKKRMAEALAAYTHGDPAFAQQVFGGETVIGRALAHETALEKSGLPDVLAWEKATALIDSARAVAVSLCYCRHKASHLGTACDAPQDVCLSLNGGADFVIRRGFGRAVDRRDALKIMTEARAMGLVQIADNVRDRPTYVCNCCGCCCGQLSSINEYGLPAVNPSGFVPMWSESACKGCSKCARACPIAAITMTPRRAEGQRKSEIRPSIDRDRCIGCGVCADACRNDAMHMARKENPSHVPQNAVERILRMAIERGKLAYLVFDAHDSPWLHRILRSVTELPMAQRLLASEQLRSRFVKVALSGQRDPTG